MFSFFCDKIFYEKKLHKILRAVHCGVCSLETCGSIGCSYHGHNMEHQARTYVLTDMIIRGGGKALTMTMTPWNLPHGQWSKKLTMTMTPSIFPMVNGHIDQF